jgi:hypothetical protein
VRLDEVRLQLHRISELLDCLVQMTGF